MTTTLLLTILASPAAAAPGVFGLQVVDLPMLLCLPVLLVLSGFFSGSETALFGMTSAQRMAGRGQQTFAARAVEQLLDDERMLLITLLLGNMTVNVLYFVISSVLMMQSTTGAAGQALMALTSLLALILFGEVGPKVLASSGRAKFAAVCAPVLLTVHRAIGPLRVVLSRGVVGPLARLTAPRERPPDLSDDEIKALFDVSGEAGVIEAAEQAMLQRVMDLRRIKVRHVMTPRINMVALQTDASRDEVEQAIRDSRLTRIPVYDGDLDSVVGVLHAKRFMLDRGMTSVTNPAVCDEPHFVPDLASLDQLLAQLRKWDSKSAIVVDEFGGTEGLVSVEDVVEEVVGDILGPDETPDESPLLVGLGRWRASGEMPIDDFARLFRVTPPETGVATIGVLVAEQLGRVPVPGDELRIENLVVTVDAMEQTRVTSIIVAIAFGAPRGGAS